MSTLKGLASIAKGLSAETPVDLVRELDVPTDSESSSTGRAKAPAKPLAKTKDQNYKRVMVLVKKNTEKKAYRKWEDTNPTKDFSDLVEALLSSYADGRISA